METPYHHTLSKNVTVHGFEYVGASSIRPEIELDVERV
jgi:hypothetical protein